MIEERIKIIRKSTGLSQRKFADKVGISFGSLQIYEKDASSITVKTVTKIAKSCGFNHNWLLTGIGDMANNIDIKNYSDETVVSFPPIVENHMDVVKQFDDHETALLANEYLLNLERKSPKEFHMAVGYLKGVSDLIDRKHIDGDRRKKKQPHKGHERRKAG